MSEKTATAALSGHAMRWPRVEIEGTSIITRGRFPRIAFVHDEEFCETDITRRPERLIQEVANSPLRADVLSFAQDFREAKPLYRYPFEWDNVAAADTSDFDKWWTGLSQATRKNCRRAEKRGLTTSLVVLDDVLVQGIKAIYDELPVRQGRRFWHYNKELEVVRRENSTYLDRSDIIGAYCKDELIGFVKVVYVGTVARIMQILSKLSHYDKRPMNALIARAVEQCSRRAVTHLIYSKFQYGNKAHDPLIEFKRRNGFKQIDFPRYYVPLTIRGRVAISCGLHRSALDLIPGALLEPALRARETVNRLRFGRSAIAPPNTTDEA